MNFDRAARWVASKTGSPLASVLALLLIVAWAVAGPFMGYSDLWLLLINTVTTIITFLMVFLIQGSQNQDTKALHAKLDELIRVNQDARNDLIGIEEKVDDN